MTIHCCYTPAHEVLFRDHFLPSVPVGFAVEATALEVAGPGNFLSPEFLDCIRRKVQLIRRSLAGFSGDWLIWSDIDIVLLPGFAEAVREVTASGQSLLAQRESPKLPDINTGFLVLRAVPEVDRFFAEIEGLLENHSDWNEQRAANALLAGGALKDWDYLPPSFYARTQGWPPPREAVLYHANYTKGDDAVGQKVAQFAELAWMRRGGEAARLWSCLRRVPALMARRFGGRSES